MNSSTYPGTHEPGHNPVSKEAARVIDPSSVDGRVRRFIASKARKGATADEIETLTGMLHQTVSPAMIRLREEGVIAKNGEKRVTRTGRRAEVHVLKKFANRV